MTPFEAVYGRPPPYLISYVPGTTKVVAVEKEFLERDVIIQELKKRIKEAQAKMKGR